jgi:replicative DNA helicase
MANEKPIRVPPNSVNAERWVLGAVLQRPELLPQVRTMITADDFYTPAHASMFRAMAFMVDHPEKLGSLSLLTFVTALESRGSLQKIVGLEKREDCIGFLTDLNENYCDPGNALYHAKTIRDHARARRFLSGVQPLVDEAWEIRGECDDFMVRAARQIESLTRLPSHNTESPTDGLQRGLDDAVSGRRRSASWPFPTLTRLAKPSAPGCVTILCGDPGSNKSFLLMQCMIYWLDNNTPASMLPLEKDRQYALTRALAQMRGDSNLTSDEWKAQHALEAQEALDTHKERLARLGAKVGEKPPGVVTLDWVGQWIAARASEGDRIIAVDPITMADSGRNPWTADRDFLDQCETIGIRHGCSIILVTHPRMMKGQRPTLETMAGGLAYARFPDVVLWLANHDPPESGTVSTSLGHMACEYTNHIALFKTRDATGRGMHVAFTFDKATLTLKEHGWIVKE